MMHDSSGEIPHAASPRCTCTRIHWGTNRTTSAIMLKIAAALALVAAVPAALATGLVQATAYSTTDCSADNVVKSFAETLACVATPDSKALSIDNTTAGCQVFIFSDDVCTSSAFVNLVNLSEKCHNTDSFNSVKIQCIQGGRR